MSKIGCKKRVVVSLGSGVFDWLGERVIAKQSIRAKSYKKEFLESVLDGCRSYTVSPDVVAFLTDQVNEAVFRLIPGIDGFKFIP